jgi:transposase
MHIAGEVLSIWMCPYRSVNKHLPTIRNIPDDLWDEIKLIPPSERPSCKQNLCLDKGYDFPEIGKETIKRKYIPHMRQRGEAQSIGLRHSVKRWVVERTNSWHNRFRKLLVRYEKKSENYLTLVCLACCIIIYRRFKRGRLD